MTTKNTCASDVRAAGQLSRRGFLKGVSIAAAAGAGSVLVGKAAAQSPAPPPGAPNGGSKLFYVVETTAGKVQGIATAGIKQF
ncbi:MAG TPA: twin-arginine translocation signal domain-containing protein, partial [Blastocatellia bacterium]|nr:twin-arginine translocation signal domain-containing protein [Blastocatellia bacterium]